MTTLYRKEGRRYVPHEVRWSDPSDGMKVGTFRLTYAYAEGGRRYEYEVTPDTAGFVAASVLYRQAIETAINEAAMASPQLGCKPYTKRQLAIIETFRRDMAATGGLVPTWWQFKSSWQISQAAIEAMKGKP